MPVALSLKQDGKWKTRLMLGLMLIGPLYLAPVLLRSPFAGLWGYGVGTLLADLFGCLVVGFLTNNYRLGVLLYVGATAFELLLVFTGHHPVVALWVSDLIPALVAIYYAQQIYFNMGD